MQALWLVRRKQQTCLHDCWHHGVQAFSSMQACYFNVNFLYVRDRKKTFGKFFYIFDEYLIPILFFIDVFYFTDKAFWVKF